MNPLPGLLFAACSLFTASGLPASAPEEGSAPAKPAPASLSSLRLDFGPRNQVVAPGWEAWSEERDRGLVAGFDLAFRATVDGDHAWRDGPLPDPGHPLARMLADGVRERDEDGIRLTFENLMEGEYLLEIFSCDVDGSDRSPVGRFDLLVNGRLVLSGLTSAARASWEAAALPPVPVACRGDAMVIEMRRQSGRIWLNGLVLSGPARFSGDVRPGRITLEAAPGPVQATIRRDLAHARLESIERRVAREQLVYSVDGETVHGELDLELDSAGSVLESTEDLPLGLAPPNVAEALARLAPGAEVVRVRRRQEAEAEQLYRIDVRQNGRRQRYEFKPDGQLVSRRER